MRLVSFCTSLFLLAAGAANASQSFAYRGAAVNVIDAVAMTCEVPYALQHDCSEWSGAALKVRLQDQIVRVAGSGDGMVVLVMPEATMATPQLTEAGAALVEDVGAIEGAKLERVEAVAVSGQVAGYLLIFDRDVYSRLRQNAAPR